MIPKITFSVPDEAKKKLRDNPAYKARVAVAIDGGLPPVRCSGCKRRLTLDPDVDVAIERGLCSACFAAANRTG